MNRRVVAALSMLVGLGLLAIGWFSQGTPETPAPSAPPRVSSPALRAQPPPDDDEPEPPAVELVDDRPDTAIPQGAEWGIPAEDADVATQEAAVDARLALPPAIVRLAGGWDGTMLVPGRIAKIESLLGKPVPAETLAALTERQAALAEQSALTVGTYRLGEIDEREALRLLQAHEQSFRDEACASLGLSPSDYDQVFGLGTL
ncbi:MAG: hypothetical protein EP330_22295 [Deltaproteobacteria bacterium]|nr:MAG: hypothetical protein EP330_22295 [Deltaproteobacteria bacterium]